MKVFQIEGLESPVIEDHPDLDISYNLHRFSLMVARPSGTGDNVFLYVSDSRGGVVRIVKFVPNTGRSSELHVERDTESNYAYPTTFSEDGKWFNSGMSIYKVDDGLPIIKLQGVESEDFSERIANNSYETLLFSHDKKTIYRFPSMNSSGNSWRIDRWHLSFASAREPIVVTAKLEDSLYFQDEWIRGSIAMACSPDGEHLATIVETGRYIHRWKLRNQTEESAVSLRTPSFHDGNFGDLEYSPDSRWLIVMGKKNMILSAGDFTPQGVIDCRGIVSWAITLDSKTVLTVTIDGRLEQWHIPSGEKLREYSFDDLIGPAECVTVSPDGFTAYVAGTEGRFLRWDLE